jgi:hypothetical protein
MPKKQGHLSVLCSYESLITSFATHLGVVAQALGVHGYTDELCGLENAKSAPRSVASMGIMQCNKSKHLALSSSISTSHGNCTSLLLRTVHRRIHEKASASPSRSHAHPLHSGSSHNTSPSCAPPICSSPPPLSPPNQAPKPSTPTTSPQPHSSHYQCL